MKKALCIFLSVVLLSGSCITGTFSANAQVVATPTDAAVIINGGFMGFEAYEIDGYNYFKLRDIAFAINGTDKNFEVVWDESTNSVRLISKTAYTPVGGEMQKKTPDTISVSPTNSAVYHDGYLQNLSAYLINGNNYFKLRDILAVFDIDVSWDSFSKLIYFDSFDQKTVRVKNAAEFMAAIGSNTDIILEPGVYDFTELTEKSTYGCVIKHVSNLNIIGAGTDKTELINGDRFKEVLTFENCRNISIRGVKAGHTPQKYECDAGVFSFGNCLDVSVGDCYLYGCGSIGIGISGSENVSVNNTVITDCSYRAVLISDSSNVVFDNCEIIKNRAYAAVITVGANLRPCSVSFNKCEIADNYNIEWAFIDAWNYSEDMGVSLVFNECNIISNMQALGEDTYFFDAQEGVVELNNCIIKNNIFRYEYSISPPRYTDCEFSWNTYIG